MLITTNNKMKSKNALTEKEKIQVVKWFAEFNTPQDVANLVMEHFGKQRVRSSLTCYLDSKKRQEQLAEFREQFRSGVEDIAYANKVVRIAKLNRVAERLFLIIDSGPNKGWLFAIDRFNNTLERIAKEMGEESRVKLSGNIDHNHTVITVESRVPKPSALVTTQN